MKTKHWITRKEIEFILKEFPESRDSDLTLGNRICEIYHVYLLWVDRVAFWNFLSRERRYFQEKGMYLASNPVGRRRKQLEQSSKEEYQPSKIDIHNAVMQQMMCRI